jgi:hypothetical protein
MPSRAVLVWRIGRSGRTGDEAVDERPSRGVLADDQKNCHATEAIESRMVTMVAHEPT